VSQELKEMLCSVISSFSCKKMLTPDVLRQKWKRKPKQEAETLPELQWFRENSEENGGVVEIMSGMGQGMFHFLSSLYHCITDDGVELVMKKVLQRTMKVQLLNRTMISSDDKTRFSMMIFSRGADDAEKGMKVYMSLLDCLYRLSNIHTNWKKSGLNFTLAEFNSVFSVGKRMVWATIKDLYNANNIPDLSIPEEAVQEILSNIRRCLEHGVHMTSLQVMVNMANKQLKRYYKMSEEFIHELCLLFECSEERLPPQLGFVPTKNLISNLLFGKDVNMFSQHNSEKLKKFYWNLYTSTRDQTDQVMKNTIPFSEDSKGKYWMEVPMSMDKVLVQTKLKFFRFTLGLSQEELLNVLNCEAINFNLGSQDPKQMRTFVKTFFLGMKRNYAENVLMSLHSLVRALQYSTRKAMIFPKSKTVLDLEDRKREAYQVLQNKAMVDKMTKEEYLEKKDSIERLNKQIDLFRVDMMLFARIILNKNEQNSGLPMRSHLKQVVDYEDKILEELKTYNKDFKMGHPSFKKVRFHLEEKGVAATPGELVKYMFENRYQTSNYVVRSAKQLFESAGHEFNTTVFNEPFSSVRSLMGGAAFPMKEFWDYLNLSFKSQKNLEVTMIGNFLCGGNFHDNLKRLYCSISHPSYQLVDPKRNTSSSQEKLNKLTKVSLGKSLLEKDKNKVQISEAEDKLSSMIKLLELSENTMTSCAKVDCKRVEYSKFANKNEGCLIQIWFNFDIFILSKEFLSTVELIVLSKEDIDDTYRENLNLWNAFGKYIFEMQASNKKIFFKTKGKFSKRTRTFFSSMSMNFKTNVKRMSSRWEVWLSVYSEFQIPFCGDDNLIGKIKLYTDHYTVNLEEIKNMELKDQYGEETSLSYLSQDPPPIEMLDQILIQNNLMKELIIPSPTSSQKGVKNQEVNDFNTMICSSNIMESLINVFRSGTLQEEATQVQKEIDLSLTSEVFNWADEVLEEEEINTLPEEMIHFEEQQDGTLVSIEEERWKSLGRTILEASELAKGVDSFDAGWFSLERYNLTSVVEQLFFKSVDMSISMNKLEMIKCYNHMKRNGNENGFHNMLLWQIMYEFEYKISHNMLLMMYNYSLRKMSNLMRVQPAQNLMLFPKEAKDRMPNLIFFVKKMKEEEMYEEASSYFY